MTHEKFCPMTIPHIPSFMCICNVIAQVRADEREQAAHRVAKAIKHNRSCIVEDAPDCWCERSIAITAARGEDAYEEPLYPDDWGRQVSRWEIASHVILLVGWLAVCSAMIAMVVMM